MDFKLDFSSKSVRQKFDIWKRVVSNQQVLIYFKENFELHHVHTTLRRDNKLSFMSFTSSSRQLLDIFSAGHV
jgi:hypothetical protein